MRLIILFLAYMHCICPKLLQRKETCCKVKKTANALYMNVLALIHVFRITVELKLQYQTFELTDVHD